MRDPGRRDRSTDIDDLKFNYRAVVGLIVFTASIIGSQWAFSAGVRTDIAALGTRMDAKDQIDARDEQARKVEDAAREKIVDDRLSAIQKRIDDIERDYKLGDYDIKGLITAQKGTK